MKSATTSQDHHQDLLEVVHSGHQFISKKIIPSYLSAMDGRHKHRHTHTHAHAPRLNLHSLNILGHLSLSLICIFRIILWPQTETTFCLRTALSLFFLSFSRVQPLRESLLKLIFPSNSLELICIFSFFSSKSPITKTKRERHFIFGRPSRLSMSTPSKVFYLAFRLIKQFFLN